MLTSTISILLSTEVNKLVNINTDEIRISFETINQFRMLAPHSVAQGMVTLANDDFDNELLCKENAAKMMDLIAQHVPQIEDRQVGKGGKETIKSYPAYSAAFSENMLKEIDAEYKSQSVTKAHDIRMKAAKSFLETFKPTISLGEALYRLSFYLISNENNLAKSTNNLISFVKKLLLNQANNMLVDSAILIGGQGKSTVQKGLLQAIETMGLKSSMCHLPTINGGVQEAFVRNEVCIDDETTFHGIDFDSLNKILDKSVVTIKGKYIKEWSAKSTANILVGTNFLPNDVNARRYSIRMVDENFKLIENFGRWTIPGTENDSFGDSYDKVVDWTTEGWLNLIWYCNNYDIPELAYENEGFDYSLQYKIRRACEMAGVYEMKIDDLIKAMERNEEEKFDYKTKQSLRNQLYICANRLQLPKVETHKNMFSVYDWTIATHIDETDIGRDNLEKTYCWFHNEDRFQVPTN